MPDCPVCSTALTKTLYASVGATSITSLCELHPEATRLRFCPACAHGATDPLTDVAGYYDHSYQILIDSEEEDQIYQVLPDRIVYRVPHQVETLRALVPLAPGATLLDYGCAKSATMRELLRVRPDVVPHLFDVSEMYVPFWARFLSPDRWATYAPPAEWAGRFDVVTSFYALEHVVDLAGALATIKGLLKPDGLLYFIVPNPYFNTADMIVIDHVNHFSRPSLETLLARHGFGDVLIDEEAHAGAFVVRARPKADADARALPDPAVVAAVRAEATAIAEFWRAAAERVRAGEAAQPPGPAAVYGSGFYGTFMATCLARLDDVVCFIDQNPHRQGKTLLGKPVVAPEALPDSVRTVYVGLNPKVARDSIAGVGAFADRNHAYVYL